MTCIRLALTLYGVLCGPAQAETALVSSRTIYPGQEIAPEFLQRVDIPTGRGGATVVTQAGDVAGMIAVRTILPGRTIVLSMLRRPYLVEAGKPVRVQYAHQGLVISLAAVPLKSGGPGDLIQLRNPGSGKSISGQVLADGSVVVGP